MIFSSDFLTLCICSLIDHPVFGICIYSSYRNSAKFQRNLCFAVFVHFDGRILDARSCHGILCQIQRIQQFCRNRISALCQCHFLRTELMASALILNIAGLLKRIPVYFDKCVCAETSLFKVHTGYSSVQVLHRRNINAYVCIVDLRKIAFQRDRHFGYDFLIFAKYVICVIDVGQFYCRICLQFFGSIVVCIVTVEFVYIQRLFVCTVDNISYQCHLAVLIYDQLCSVLLIFDEAVFYFIGVVSDIHTVYALLQSLCRKVDILLRHGQIQCVQDRITDRIG